jgi:hypothetical protein
MCDFLGHVSLADCKVVVIQVCHYLICVLTRRRGADTAHTQMGLKWDGLHTRHSREFTHNVARQSTVRTHAVAAPSSSERGGRLAPTPSQQAASLSRSPTPNEAMCTATDSQALCLQREPRRRRPAHSVLVLPFRSREVR